jgi:3-hydroxybutyryl-CoA dehydratase
VYRFGLGLHSFQQALIIDQLWPDPFKHENKMSQLGIKEYFFEDLSLGMREGLMKTVMSDDVVGFATLTGDHNPIHLSDHFARKTRFGGRIAHGLYTASLISAVLGMRLPGPGAIYLSQTLNFRAPVRIGDVVSIVVEVIELVPEGRRCRLKCEAIVDGKIVLDGEALVMVPARKVKS